MSSNPPFFHRIRNAWKSIALPRSQHEGTLPISSPSRVTRIRSFTIGFPQNLDSEISDCFPLYANAIEIEKLDYHLDSRFSLPPKIVSLLPKIVSLTFQAALGYHQTMSTSQDQPFILGAALVIAFAASFSVMFIKHSHPRLAAIVQKIGYLSFALSFFVMTRVFFPGSLITWIILGGLALANLAFLIGCPI